MYYDREKEPDGLGFVTSAIVGGTAVLSSVLGVGSKYWAQSEAAEAQKKALQQQVAAKQKAEAAAMRALMRQQDVEVAEAVYTEASQRRRNTVYALYAVGGVATAISLVLIAGTLRKGR